MDCTSSYGCQYMACCTTSPQASEKKVKQGRLEVVCGSMFSGKSEELIRRLRRAEFARQKVQAFKHSLDDRTTLEHIHAHSGEKLAAMPVSTPWQLEQLILEDTQIVGIDEVQFFDESIIVIVDALVRAGKRVIVAGLDLDFRGIPFGPMPVLLALADEVVKLKAVCVKTGADAHFTQRLEDGKPASYKTSYICIGGAECYEARSRDAYEIDHSPLAEYVELFRTVKIPVQD